MTAPFLRPAELDEDALQKVHALEEQLGCPLVAYSRQNPYASLSSEQVSEVQRAERELGVQLLAYRA